MTRKKQFVAVLGIAQDGGYPQSGCNKKCCSSAWKNPKLNKHVSCLAIIDPESNQSWMIDATPDFKEQLHMLKSIVPTSVLNGILLTHAHTGHYTGLINLGKEIMNSKLLPVFAAPRMKKLLIENYPWNQLVENKNIEIAEIEASKSFKLNDRINITSFIVPHRDEFSETLGFRIEGRNKSVIYIPDIDSWEEFETKLEDIVISTDRVFIDGTFYNKKELQYRDITKIPHPSIADTLKLLDKLPRNERKKVFFIHLNHTNPVIRTSSLQRKHIINNGYNVAQELMKFDI